MSYAPKQSSASSHAGRPLRCLIAWELGSNSGHLVRCLALAKALHQQGHVVLIAARDLCSAEQVLGAEGFPFVQAPLLAQRHKRSPRPPINYADMLLQCGWCEQSALTGSVRAWLNLFSLSRPDVMIVDHAPTALLAGHIARLPCVAVGNGFDIPPSQSPLPAFQSQGISDSISLAQTELDTLRVINACLYASRCPPFERVAELFDRAHTVLATFAELDHYGYRSGQNYPGVFYQYAKGVPAAWPPGGGPRVIAYLRASNSGALAMLAALHKSGCRSLCVIPDAEPALLAQFSAAHLTIHTKAIALAPLLAEADLVIGYGSTAFTTQTLRAGVAQLMLPHVVEQALFAQRIVELGAGVSLAGTARSEAECSEALHRMLQAKSFTDAARKFAARYRDYDETASMASVVAGIVNLAEEGCTAGRTADGLDGQVANAAIKVHGEAKL